MADAGGRPDGSVPRLAGQRVDVLAARLHALREGRLDLPVMAPFARSLGAAEVDTVAVWLSTLPAPADIGLGPGDDLPRGQALFAERCAACHGVAGEGALATPRVCGQHSGYVLRRLDEIALQKRSDAHPAMAAIVAAMLPAERAAVADFLSRGDCLAPEAP
jgi:cytochrome c553